MRFWQPNHPLFTRRTARRYSECPFPQDTLRPLQHSQEHRQHKPCSLRSHFCSLSRSAVIKITQRPADLPFLFEQDLRCFGRRHICRLAHAQNCDSHITFSARPRRAAGFCVSFRSGTAVHVRQQSDLSAGAQAAKIHTESTLHEPMPTAEIFSAVSIGLILPFRIRLAAVSNAFALTDPVSDRAGTPHDPFRTILHRFCQLRQRFCRLTSALRCLSVL